MENVKNVSHYDGYMEEKKAESIKLDDDSFVKSKEKEEFLSVINKKGFVLEYKAEQVVKKTLQEYALSKFMPNRIYNFRDVRREIDMIFTIPFRLDVHFVCEVKRTDFDWIFARYKDKDEKLKFDHSYFCLIADSDDGVYMDGYSAAHEKYIVSSHFEVMFDKARNLIRTSSKDIRVAHKEIREYISQVLLETEAYLTDREVFLRERDDLINKFKAMGIIHNPEKNKIFRYIIPIIITNANLWVLDINETNIDDRGDLIDYSRYSNVPYLIYNRPEKMLWDNDKKIIEWHPTKKDYLNPHLKSVIILNIKIGRAHV